MALRLSSLSLVACALAIAPPAAVSAEPAARDAGRGCSKLNQDQRVVIGVSFRYLHTRSRVVNGTLDVKTFRDVTKRFARVGIGAATCKRPGGRWIVIKPIRVGHSSSGIDPVGNVRKEGLREGWGVGSRGGKRGAKPELNLQVMHCGEGNFFETISTLNGVPIPGLSFATTVIKWIAGGLLPEDTVECGDLGTKVIKVRANKRGLLTIREDDRTVVEQKVTRNEQSGFATRFSYDPLPISVERIR